MSTAIRSILFILDEPVQQSSSSNMPTAEKTTTSANAKNKKGLGKINEDFFPKHSLGTKIIFEKVIYRAIVLTKAFRVRGKISNFRGCDTTKFLRILYIIYGC